MLREFEISPNDAGQRADRYIRRRLPGLSAARLHSLFRRREIKVERRPISGGHVLSAGDRLRIFGLRNGEVGPDAFSHPPPPGPVPSLPIVHEDAELLVLDKPGNLAVHPGTGIAPGRSLIEMAAAYLASTQEPSAAAGALAGEIFRPALVHRLDKETSGLILVAKSGRLLRELGRALREGRLEKVYLALVEGVPRPERGVVQDRLLRVDSRGGGAKSVPHSAGKTAITRYSVAKKAARFSLLRVIIKTGRMHQIRSHLSLIGHPIVGDTRYGSFAVNRRFRSEFGLRRAFLHASELGVEIEGRRTRFFSPLPQELRDCLERLEAAS